MKGRMIDCQHEEADDDDTVVVDDVDFFVMTKNNSLPIVCRRVCVSVQRKLWSSDYREKSRCWGVPNYDNWSFAASVMKLSGCDDLIGIIQDERDARFSGKDGLRS
jgi:hypothetical protein